MTSSTDIEADRRVSVTVLGSINIDIVVRTRRFPKPGETILASSVKRHGGGKGANQALAAARAGANTRLLGSVGDDSEGPLLLSILHDAGVDCAYVRVDPNLPTGMAFITVDKAGENQIIVVPGANETAIDEVGDHQGVLLAQLELPLATVSSFFRRRRNPSLTILNAAPFQAEAQPLFGLADVVVINETELAAYLGFPEPPANAEAIASNARTLLSRDGQHIVITLGERGSVTVGEDRTLVAAAPPAKVVDTTGAGDCFCGYLAAGLGAGLNLEAAIHTAHYAATLAVSAPGASSSIPSMLDVTILPADLSGELDPVSAFDPKQTLTALLRFFRQ